MRAHPRSLVRRETDRATLERLDRLCFAGEPPPRWGGAVWWAARRPNGFPVAFAGLKRRGFVWELVRAGVAPEARGEGLQLRLIRAREAFVARAGGGLVTTYTAAHGLASANNLIRAGYRLYRPREAWGLPGSLYFSRRVGR